MQWGHDVLNSGEGNRHKCDQLIHWKMIMMDLFKLVEDENTPLGELNECSEYSREIVDREGTREGCYLVLLFQGCLQSCFKLVSLRQGFITFQFLLLSLKTAQQ